MDTDDWTMIVTHMLASEARMFRDSVGREAGDAADYWIGIVKAAINATDADRDNVLRAVALEIVGAG